MLAISNAVIVFRSAAAKDILSRIIEMFLPSTGYQLLDPGQITGRS